MRVLVVTLLTFKTVKLIFGHPVYTQNFKRVSYDTKKCVFIPSLPWHTALEK